MERTYALDIKPGKEYLIYGWVSEVRNLGSIKFILLRDKTGLIQVTAIKDKTKSEIFEQFSKLTKESVIQVKGKAVENKKAPNGIELIPENVELIAKAETPLPIDITDFSKTDISKRLDLRFLDLHNPKVLAIFKIQSTISSSFREFFIKQNFIEVQPPSIISSASEGGTELFPVMYFEKPAYLAQSPQLYKQMLISSMEKVVMITPVWRAEKHNTIRHLNESRQMDIEMAFADEFIVMKQLEGVVKYIVENVLKQNKEELKILDLKLKVPSSKYLTYEETIKLLQKNKIEVEEGDDISPEAERKLYELFPDTIIFVHDWPLKLKPFYIIPKTLNENEKISRGFDALYGGIEISSGGQRVHIPELLIKRLKEKNLNPKNFEYYINSFRYGSSWHSGWSIGLERFTMALLKLNNIREACLFPRDRDRLVP